MLRCTALYVVVVVVPVFGVCAGDDDLDEDLVWLGDGDGGVRDGHCRTGGDDGFFHGG